jgi:hypothetical protein
MNPSQVSGHVKKENVAGGTRVYWDISGYK